MATSQLSAFFSFFFFPQSVGGFAHPLLAVPTLCVRVHREAQQGQQPHVPASPGSQGNPTSKDVQTLMSASRGLFISAESGRFA